MIASRLLLLAALAVPWAAAGDEATFAELNQRAVALLERKEYDDAIRLLEAALAGRPADPTVARNLAVARNNRGLHHLHEGRFGPAIGDFEAAVRRDGQDPAFLVHLGYAHLKSRDFLRAQGVLEEARRRFPEEPRVYEFLGFLYDAQDELEKAEQAYVTHQELAADERIARQLEKVRRELAVAGDFVDRTSSDFTLKFLGSEANHAIAEEVLAILADARTRIGSDLDVFPRTRTTVLLYSDADFRKATGAHAWVGGLYDGKIRIPVRDFARQRAAIIRTIHHEYVHRLVAELAPHCPIWLNEGLAEWYEDEGRGAHERLRELARGGPAPPPFVALKAAFAAETDAARVRLQYAASLSFVTFLRHRHGPNGLRSLLVALGRGEEVDAALARLTGSGLADLDAQWRREILR